MSTVNFKLKDEYRDKIVGFNNSGEALGNRNDLHILVDMAVRSGDKDLKNLFSELPTIQELDAAKADNFLASNPAPATPAAVTATETKVPGNASEERVAVETGNAAAPVVTPLKSEKPAKTKTAAQKLADEVDASTATTTSTTTDTTA